MRAYFAHFKRIDDQHYADLALAVRIGSAVKPAHFEQAVAQLLSRHDEHIPAMSIDADALLATPPPRLEDDPRDNDEWIEI